jgi:hypothetical protein
MHNFIKKDLTDVKKYDTLEHMNNTPPPPAKVINSRYFHVDNGGFTFEVNEFGDITIDFGFYGYSTTKIVLSSRNTRNMNTKFDVEELANFFNESKFKLDEFNKTK